MYVCLNPTVKRELPGGSDNPGLHFSRKNQGNAQTTENYLLSSVLFVKK